ncbi:DUF296 domain-containing protein [candidate division KSB1 bacterium]|nr:DUF296 domain-containing protein [candidate division KSB1 bacterium]
MKLHRVADSILVRFDPDDRYPESFVETAKQHDFSCGTVTAIGAVREVELAYYDLDRREYVSIAVPGVVELVSLSGNLTLLNGEPYFHVHAVVGDRAGKLHGGHLLKFVVALSVECRLDLMDIAIGRVRDERTGLNVLQIGESPDA